MPIAFADPICPTIHEEMLALLREARRQTVMLLGIVALKGINLGMTIANYFARLPQT
jgi:hypothetical protein